MRSGLYEGMPSDIGKRLEAFDNAHGGRDAIIRSSCGGWWLFPDGARREVSPMGRLEDVPERRYFRNDDQHSLEVIERKADYFNAKLKLRQSQFEELKKSLIGTDYADHEFEDLERMIELVDDASTESEAINAERYEHPILKARRERERAMLEDKRRIELKKERLNGLRI